MAALYELRRWVVFMKGVKKSLLLAYTPREMCMLVTDIEHYPDFLPWCSQAETLETTPDSTTARLHIAYMGIRQSFTTRNHHEGDRRVSMSLVQGPFSALEGEWQFSAVGSNAAIQGCRIDFSLAYAFNNRALELVVSPVFDRIAATFVDAFVSRAEAVYGPR
jgi:ribosome-associated toxin RatA of RatAB toxin-antitoxin module